MDEFHLVLQYNCKLLCYVSICVYFPSVHKRSVKSIYLSVRAELPAQMLVSNNIDPSTTDEVKLVPTEH